MDLMECAMMLRVNALRIEILAHVYDDEQSRWKPDPDTWSVLEVVNHLVDEEKYDFRIRLERILFEQDKSFEPIDPEGWVTEHAYNEREHEPSLKEFAEVREYNLQRLVGLEKVDWEVRHPYADWATAGNMLASWVAHDLLHMRQLVELHWAWTQRQVAPYSTRYAGEW